jgi:hypothetical protein
MTDGVTAIFFGIGVGTWVYTKVSHSSGGNYTQSYTVAGVVGLFATGVFYMLIKQVFHF